MKKISIIIAVSILTSAFGCASVTNVRCDCPIGDPIAIISEDGQTKVFCAISEKGSVSTIVYRDTKIVSEMYVSTPDVNLRVPQSK